MERNIQKSTRDEIYVLSEAKLRSNIKNIIAEGISAEIHMDVIDEVLLSVSNIICEIRDKCDERI